MSKKLLLFFSLFFLLFTLLLPLKNKALAQTCLGSIQCAHTEYSCRDGNGSSCLPGTQGCVCSNQTQTYNVACGGIPPVCGGQPCIDGDTTTGGGSCSTGGSTCGNGICEESCSSCPSDCGSCNPCGSGAYQACAGGVCCANDGFPICASGVGCCPAGYPYVCNGNCSATPSCNDEPPPTTAPPPTQQVCQYGSCSGSGTNPSSDTSGYYSCSGGCWQWNSCPSGQIYNGTSCVIVTEPPPPPPPGSTCTGSCRTAGSGAGGCPGTWESAPGTCSVGSCQICNPSTGGGDDGGGLCFPPEEAYAHVFVDTNGNNQFGTGEGVSSGTVTMRSDFPGAPSGLENKTASIQGSSMGAAAGRYAYLYGTNPYTISTSVPNIKGLDITSYTVTPNGGGTCPTYGNFTHTFVPTTGGSTSVTFSPPAGNHVVNVVIDAPYTISGTVYQDLNGDGVRNTAETTCPVIPFLTTPATCISIGATCNGNICWFDTDGDSIQDVQEPGVSGVQVKRDGAGSVAQQTSNTTTSNGNYTISSVYSGSYELTVLNVPSQYGVGSTPNPVTVGPSATNQNFGLVAAAICPAGTTRTVAGSVYLDTLNNNCSSGFTAIQNQQLQLAEEDGTLITSGTTDSGGVYSLTDTLGCMNRYITVVGETIKAVRADGATTWSTTGFSGSDFGPFDFTSSSKLVSFCISNVTPWFQVTTGDVRYPNLINPIPAATFGALGPTYPGIFISSQSLVSNTNVSTQNWKVGDEYDYNRNFASGKGGMAYEFYAARAKERGVTINPLDTFSNTALGSMPSGVYKIVGDTTISGSSINFGAAGNQGKHIVLLVDGDVNLNTEISIPAGQGTLFVLAAKGDITIGSDVGTTNESSTTSNLAGYYTAQGDITLVTKANCTTSTPDERLNVGGALIANALNPFSATGNGQLVNNRTLCADDENYPTLYVATRVDFLTQLTDFYKTVYKTFREIEP